MKFVLLIALYFIVILHHQGIFLGLNLVMSPFGTVSTMLHSVNVFLYFDVNIRADQEGEHKIDLH